MIAWMPHALVRLRARPCSPLVQEQWSSAHSYSSLHSILKNGLDRPRREPTTDGPAITHPNIRGADYFH
jgi:hypothetical protein